MSDTPRTDAVVADWPRYTTWQGSWHKLLDHARHLEREVVGLQEERDYWKSVANESVPHAMHRPLFWP